MTDYTCPMHPEIVQDKSGSCSICGMSLIPIGKKGDDAELKEMSVRFWVSLALTVAVLYCMMTHNRYGEALFATPIILWGAYPFYHRALHSSTPNMFTLISIGIGAAGLMSYYALFTGLPLYFETAAVITTLVLLGQMLELRAYTKTGHAIEGLMLRIPAKGFLIKNGKEEEIDISHIKAGDILRIKPGGKIPVDGIIVDGNSWIDESMMTGEANPVEKSIDSLVLAGTLNQTGSFLMRAAKVGEETLLAQIVRKVQDASRTKAPIQRLADQISAYFVPIVIAISILTFFIWLAIGPEPKWNYALMNAISVLIIACPCALGLATPMSIVVGMGKGAHDGILFKNSASLENLHRIDTLILDKTGTLTEGKPSITETVLLGGWDHGTVHAYAKSIEAHSEHPIAKAFKEGSELPVNGFVSFPGGGLKGIIDGHTILIGHAKFIKENGIDIREETGIFLAIDHRPAAKFILQDKLKDSTKGAIDSLKDKKIELIILSGDQKENVEKIARELDIADYFYGVNPDEKLEIVRKYPRGAMAGDGVNDAPALALAYVGIAMGNGIDIAIESADVTLVKGNLNSINRAIDLSRKVMKNIRQNLFFAFAYNVVGIPIAAGILYPFTGTLLSPMIAALAMSLSSVSVIGNALRLRSQK